MAFYCYKSHVWTSYIQETCFALCLCVFRILDIEHHFKITLKWISIYHLVLVTVSPKTPSCHPPNCPMGVRSL